MSRYFLEVAYKGKGYSGFQIQQNAVTIQSEVEKALLIYCKKAIELTGSSRTDAGVHATQNFFHFDTDRVFTDKEIYHLNAILPSAIVIKNIIPVTEDAHCRFDAIAREYYYHIYQHKDPFLEEYAWYYPYKLNLNILNQTAAILLRHNDFTSFSKRNTQVNNFQCSILISEWIIESDSLQYHVKGNRFLRGMVRGLVGTMLKAAIGKITVEQFEEIILQKDCTKADFTSPSHGLFLHKVHFPDTLFLNANPVAE